MRLWQFASIPACALVLLQACDKTLRDPPPSGADASTSAAERDGRSDEDEVKGAASREAARPRIVVDLAAANFVASVSDKPMWPESDAGARRMGYLRNGAVVKAYDPPLKNDACKDGWYELVEGGYVCGKVATIDMTNPRVRLAPKQPDRDAGMPYRYGVNVVDGTPLYRRVLSVDDRKKYEPHLSPPKLDENSANNISSDNSMNLTNSSNEESAPIAAAMPGATSGEGEKAEEPALARAAIAEEEASPPRRTTRDKREKDRERDRSKDPFKDRDAGRPQLKELKGRGVLVRKMARGFVVALDRDFKAAGTRWWRTTYGFAAPYDRLMVRNEATKYAGNWFTTEGAVVDPRPFSELVGADAAGEEPGLAMDAGAPLAGTVAFAMIHGLAKLEIAEDAKGKLKVGWGASLPRRSAVLLTGREATVSGVTYHQTSAGFWVRLAELRIAQPQIPSDVGPDERWIDVDLTRQQLVAFEGRRPVFATLISSGRRNPYDAERDFATPPGTFRIREKHVTTTMDGDVASDGPYSIEDVPWVMYYQGSYAIHGAFWHDNFGNVRSHGCVNISPEDARALFNWTEPQLPTGWHGVFSKDDSSGSRVVVHEDPPPGKRRAR